MTGIRTEGLRALNSGEYVWTEENGFGPGAKVSTSTGTQTVAGALDSRVSVSLETIEVLIPTDFSELADAIEYHSKTSPAEDYEIVYVLESGYRLGRGLRFLGGDYSKHRITSEDDYVYLSLDFVGVSNAQWDLASSGTLARENNLFVGVMSILPIIDCTIDMEGFDAYGIYALFCKTFVTSGSGIINSGYRNCSMSGGNLYANEAYFSGSGSEAVRLQQGCVASLQAANLDDSVHNPFPGTAQASLFTSRGSLAQFQDGRARRSGGYALECHRARISAVEADVSGSKSAGGLLHKGEIIFRLGNASGCEDGFSLYSNCELDASGADLNTDNYSIRLTQGGNTVNAYGASGKSGGGSAFVADIEDGNGHSFPGFNIPYRNGIVYANVPTVLQTLIVDSYSPSTFQTTNVSDVSVTAINYVRVGNTVTVTGEVTVTTNSNNTSSQFQLSLPFTSNLITRANCAGSGTLVNQNNYFPVAIRGDSSTNRVAFLFTSGDSAGSQTIPFSFTYIVQS